MKDRYREDREIKRENAETKDRKRYMKRKTRAVFAIERGKIESERLRQTERGRRRGREEY